MLSLPKTHSVAAVRGGPRELGDVSPGRLESRHDRLRKASKAIVTFKSAGDEKGPYTGVSVFVSTRVLRTLNILLARRENLADSDAWRGGAEGGKHSYSVSWLMTFTFAWSIYRPSELVALLVMT